MGNSTKGYIVFIAAMGTMFALIADDLASISSWHEATTPQFIASMFAHLGAVIGAYVGGRIHSGETK